MKNLIIFHFPFLFLMITFTNGQINEATGLQYFNQTPPGLESKLFAPEIISTGENELNIVFTPDGNECFFTVWNEGINTIMTIKSLNGQRSKRSIASFSGKYSDVDPHISSDGKKLFFSSMRPLEINGEAKDSDIWFVEKDLEGNWGIPKRLESINTLGKDDYYTSITNDGTIYFSIFDSHGSPGNIYYSKKVDGTYQKPVPASSSINTEFNEHDPYISPDESYLIFTSNRPGGYGRGDLYISFKNNDGHWSAAQNMGKRINSEAYDFCPMVTFDSKYLFYTKNINRNGDIYWISSQIIDSLKHDYHYYGNQP